MDGPADARHPSRTPCLLLSQEVQDTRHHHSVYLRRGFLSRVRRPALSCGAGAVPVRHSQRRAADPRVAFATPLIQLVPWPSDPVQRHSCHITPSVIFSVSPPGARAMGRALAAWLTAVRQGCRLRVMQSRRSSTSDGPGNRVLSHSGRNPTLSKFYRACSPTQMAGKSQRVRRFL